jgi:hypothetical protein
MKWSELKKQGIDRCCAMFTSGKRCRRRVADQTAPWEDQRRTFCERHAPVMAAAVKYNSSCDDAAQAPEEGADNTHTDTENK